MLHQRFEQELAPLESSLLPGSREAQDTQSTRAGFIVRRPRSTPGRLIFPLTKARCCSTNRALEEYHDNVPQELTAYGVTQEEWAKWANKLESQVQRKSMSIMTVVLGLVLVVTAPLVIIRHRRYQRAMQQWLDGFNKEVMQPHGLYATTQTGVFQFYRTREEISWLAVATTHAEADALQEEPHLWMYNIVSGKLEDNRGCRRALWCGCHSWCGQEIVV